jgi:hypothetical protein
VTPVLTEAMSSRSRRSIPAILNDHVPNRTFTPATSSSVCGRRRCESILFGTPPAQHAPTDATQDASLGRLKHTVSVGIVPAIDAAAQRRRVAKCEQVKRQVVHVAGVSAEHLEPLPLVHNPVNRQSRRYRQRFDRRGSATR